MNINLLKENFRAIIIIGVNYEHHALIIDKSQVQK